MLLESYASLLEEGWSDVFSQGRTHRRAVEHALNLPMVLGRRTLSRSICSLDRANQDWSADYKLFSRSDWDTQGLFAPVLRQYLDSYPRGPIPIALDDTKVAKSGKKIPWTSWHRDPMSPPFHVNFLYGLRFIQGSLLFPRYRKKGSMPRALPVRFENAPVIRKPGDSSSEDIEQAFNNGEILRTHIMRPTWHFILPEDIGWMLDLTAPRVKSFLTNSNLKIGLDDVLFEKSNTLIARALDGHTTLTRLELKTILAKNGIVTDVRRLAHIIMRAELDGLMMQRAVAGKAIHLCPPGRTREENGTA